MVVGLSIVNVIREEQRKNWRYGKMIRVIVEDRQEMKYPKLMVSVDCSDRIVLFFAMGVGVVVVSHDKRWVLGHYSNGWNMTNFKDYNGSITLTNANS